MARLSRDNLVIAQEIIARYPRPKSALIPLLHLAQEQDGWLAEDAMEHLAELVGVTPAEVLGTASFYEMFKREPVGRYVINVCTDIACSLVGGEMIASTDGIGYAIFNGLLARNRSAAVVPWVLLAPVVAMTSAALLLQQIPTAAEVAGGVLLVAGVLVSGIRTLRSRPRSPADPLASPSASASEPAPRRAPEAELRLGAGQATPERRISAE